VTKKFLFIALIVALVLSMGIGMKAPARAQGMTLTVWVPPVFAEAKKQQLLDYGTAMNINMEIVVFPTPFEQSLLAKWAAGDRPDLIYWHAIGNWLVQLNPIENLQDLSGEAFIERTIPGLIDKSSTFQGKVYGALLGYPFLDGVFYNKPFFAEHKLTIPKNYADLLALCETIKTVAPDVAPIYVGGGDQWPLQVLPFMMWNDDLKAKDLIAKVNTNEAKFTDPVFVDGVAKQKELLDKGCYNKDILTAKFVDEQNSLMEGKAAMVFQGTWLVGSLLDSFGLEKLNENVGFFGLSTNSNAVSWQTTAGAAVYAPKTGDADREAASKSFVNWATGDGYQKFLTDSKEFPVLTGYDVPKDVPTVLVEANDAFLKDGLPQYQQTLLASYGAFESYLSEMVTGTITPEQVMEKMDAEYQRSAKLMGLPGFE
jgi:raffinose/stachyose/melibiose transport system substrate-binding protein